MKSIKKLSIIIPVYNETLTIAEIIRRVKAVRLPKQIIVVDDGSTDGTSAILRKIASGKRTELIVLFHPSNLGKGMAIRTAIKQASGDYTIIQDADLEYDPRDYHKLLKPVLEGKGEVVYGSRFTGEHRNMFFWHLLANRLLTLVTNVLYNTTLSDMETCYKLFPTALLKSIKLRASRFDFEPEITAKILKQKIRIYEIPISYAGREYHQGKKITWVDGLIAFYALLKYRFID